MALTVDQLATLRADVLARIQTDAALAAAYAARDIDALATLMSVGRVRFNDTTVGNGTILDVFGLDKGTQVLDAVHANPAYKYVITLLDQGRAQPRTATFQKAVATLVNGGMIDQAGADKLFAVAQEPDPLNRVDVVAALFNDDGTAK